MPIAIEFLNLVVPIKTIEANYPGGWSRFCKDNEISVSNPDPALTDGELLRVGGMDRSALLMAEGDMTDMGLKGFTEKSGKKFWKDYCIFSDLESVKDTCDWLVAGDKPGTVRLASKNIHKPSTDKLWARTLTRLDSWDATWRNKIVSLGQIDMLKKRQAGLRFSDDEIFEGMLKSVLSNSTNWQIVKDNMVHFPAIFESYSLAAYATKDRSHVNDTLIPWFKARKAGSFVLRKSLFRLIELASKLKEESDALGSADNFFDAVLVEAKQDRIKAVELLGTDTPFKLRGMGIPLAAEAMKNIGYDVAKPDRHICRALGCFGLVTYQNWSDQNGTKAPAPSQKELIETMRVMETWANSIGEAPSYVDQVLWLLCAKMGMYLPNSELKSMV